MTASSCTLPADSTGPPDQPQRPSLARVSPAAGIPVPARCGRGEQATLNITQGLEPPGASPSEPGRRSPRHPATTVRVSRRNPRPAQVGGTRGGEHGPGAAERPLSPGGVGRAPAPKRRRRGQQWQGREPNPVLRARQVVRPHPTAATRGLGRPAPASSTGAHFPGAAAGRAGVRGPLLESFCLLVCLRAKPVLEWGWWEWCLPVQPVRSQRPTSELYTFSVRRRVGLAL